MVPEEVIVYHSARYAMNNNTMYWYVLRMRYRMSKEATVAERWRQAYGNMPGSVVSLTDMNSLECKLLGEGIERPPV